MSANTVYNAGDRDHHGLRAGEFRSVRNGRAGAISWGEGKPRDLDRARRSAIWPDATDEQLCAEPDALRAMLEARLPALLADFRRVVEGAGFLWTP